MMTPVRIVVTGVAGSGKTTVGRLLADLLDATYLEGDSVHPPENVAKMRAGHALSDEDRWPWLAGLRSRLRSEERIVISCSALKKRYRDVLRGAGNVRFVFLDVDERQAYERVAVRPGHFMGPEMVPGQFAVLEPPEPDEADVATVAGSPPIEEVAARVAQAVEGLEIGGPSPLLADGAVDRMITAAELEGHIVGLADREIIGVGARRILLVPPDHTRLHSRAGEITGTLFECLIAAGCDVWAMPALGTHFEMTTDDVKRLLGDRVPYDRVLHHRWRDGLVRLGEIGSSEMAVLSGGRYSEPIPVEVDGALLDDWDLIVSVGQVVPHEVIGMANYTKNLVVGLGGAPTIHRSHFLGAVSDMETIMGRTTSPVRDMVDAAFDRFIADRVDVLWILTVMEDTPNGVVNRGLYAGRGRSSETGGAAYRAAAALAGVCNIELIDTAYRRVVCWLDPDEFHSMWLGNKAIYRTRMAMADGGELIVLAPGVRQCGEDSGIDRLIRLYGYRGTAATLEAMGADPDLAASLGAAAHLIHGSSEGRFRIVYCTDPSSGGLTQAEVEGVGFEWRPLAGEVERFGVDGGTPTGPRTGRDGQPFEFIAHPTLGLWASRERLG
jgi:carbohydrate kinase (thermoresistant glucokinase family)